VAELQKALAALAEPGREADGSPSGSRSPRPEDYDSLDSAELLAVLPSLEGEDLQELRRHEQGHRARADVLAAIDGLLAPRRARAGQDRGT
jgi:hypothetical protein